MAETPQKAGSPQADSSDAVLESVEIVRTAAIEAPWRAA